jgi:hypothetical protein
MHNWIFMHISSFSWGFDDWMRWHETVKGACDFDSMMIRAFHLNPKDLCWELIEKLYFPLWFCLPAHWTQNSTSLYYLKCVFGSSYVEIFIKLFSSMENPFLWFSYQYFLSTDIYSHIHCIRSRYNILGICSI